MKFTPAGHRSMAFFGVFFHPRPLRSARNPGSAAQGGVAKGRRCGTSPRSQPGSENGKFPSFLQVAAPGGRGARRAWPPRAGSVSAPRDGGGCGSGGASGCGSCCALTCCFLSDEGCHQLAWLWDHGKGRVQNTLVGHDP